MRILMVAQFYPPIIGGIEQHVRNLSRALVKRGHEVAVVTLLHGGSDDEDVDEGVRIYRIRGTITRGNALFSGERRHSPPMPDPEALMGIRKVVKKERPEIVHAHNWFIHSFVPLKAWSGAKLLMTLHDYSLVCAKHNLIYEDALCSGPQLGKCLSCAREHYGTVKGFATYGANSVMSIPQRAAVDMFLPVSRAVAEGNRLVGSRSHYKVIPNFVPDDVAVLSNGDLPQLASLPKTPYILFVGDLRHLKGIDILVRAYAGLKDAPPLVMIGRECPDTPKELPPNAYIFNSWPHDAVMHAWNGCLIGVAPSVWADPCPTVVIEAMAMGHPIVTSRLGGMLDMVTDNETGFLTPPGDVEALRATLQRLIDDPALRDRMGAAARQRAVEFQEGKVIPQIEQVYRDLIEKPVQ